MKACELVAILMGRFRPLDEVFITFAHKGEVVVTNLAEVIDNGGASLMTQEAWDVTTAIAAPTKRRVKRRARK